MTLVDHVARGKWLDLRANGEDSRTCSAAVIRDILRGRLAADRDPHGIRLRGAKITGRLDLECLTTDVNLELADCLLEEGVIANDARLATVVLTGCQIEHPAEPPLGGARLTCSLLGLDGVRVIGHAQNGAVDLSGAHIGGDLDCAGAELRNDSGPGLRAHGLQVDQNVHLRGGFTAAGSGLGGAVRLSGAHIGGHLDCTGAELRNDSGPGLRAHGLQVDQNVYLRGGFTATGCGYGAAVDLSGAHIGGHLDCTGAKLSSDCGAALAAKSLQVGLDMRLASDPPSSADDFTATGTGSEGAVNLTGAHIGGKLDCTGAKLCNDSGPALSADGLQVDQDVYLGGEFTATGSGDDGAVNLTSAHIGGKLDCTGAKLSNDSGSGLLAYGLQVAQDMYLSGGFTATASGRAAVRLTDANIGGNLDCHRASMQINSGPALLAYGVQVGQDMYLTEGFTAIGAGEDKVTVNLRAARVGGAFHFELKTMRLEHQTHSCRRLSVDGLTYPGVPQRICAQDWRKLLRDGTPNHAAQPYQLLAAGYRALGDDRQARQTLIRQRDDQLARAQPRPRWSEKLWGKITKVTLGYGYQPWRALLFLAAVVAVSCVLAWSLGAHGALAQTSKTATPRRSCTVVQQVSVGLDLNLPVGTSMARAACDLTSNAASATATWLTAVGWVLRLLAWVFAALFIAGFTSAVRKT
jgi:hypothetical protein